MIRESFGNSFGALVLLDRTRRESVIANDPIVRERHVSFRRASLLVVPSKLLEPNGQDRIAAVETRQLVFPAQFLNFEFGAGAGLMGAASPHAFPRTAASIEVYPAVDGRALP